LIWANSFWGFSYFAFWDTHLTIAVGPFVLSESLRWWINEGLMALFFFVVGLEIKRAVIVGELSRLQDAFFPVLAAVGGMLVPAIIFSLVNLGSFGTLGWPIPMATDIALALGVLALLGSKIPTSLKLFLSTLAIADDIGSVIVIAVFFSTVTNLIAIAAALVLIVFLIIMNRAGIQYILLYAILSLGVWLAFLISGVPATISGVVIAATIPAIARVNTEDFCSKSHILLKDFEEAKKPGESVLTNRTQRTAIVGLQAVCRDVQTPLQRMEYHLQPWVGFGIVPLFALANAGVLLGFDISVPAAGSVAVGIVLGLVFGKQLGVMLFSWLSVRTGLATMPKGLSWRQIHGVSCLAGIGFTMSLFMADLTFSGVPLLDTAKNAILIASLIAGIVGFFLLGGTTILSKWRKDIIKRFTVKTERKGKQLKPVKSEDEVAISE
jgi:NhaA family Na+:H+ antiporter